MMASGQVRWFDDIKGYGYIAQSEGADVFVHYSVIEMSNFKTLAEGDVVEFESIEDEMGPRATRVSVVRRKPPKEA